MSFNFKKIWPHLLVIIGFAIASYAYFSPVLSGQRIFQSDIHQYQGLAREMHDFKEKHQHETYWVDNAFGGMPTYLLGANYPDNFVKGIDRVLMFLPRPVDYLFLYFVGLYILFLVLKVDYKLAAIGALAFGFSTYLIIILGVGHNSKAHAIAYMPMVLAGIFLVFKKRYLWGGLLLALSLALEIHTGHFQIVYYLLLSTIILGIVYLYKAFKEKKLPQFFKAIGVMVIAAILGVAANATALLATQQYTKFSTRGDTGLTITPTGDQQPESGLSYDYITEYSYGFAETLNLFIPRFTGGASTETLDKDSHSYAYLTQLGVPAYQAEQILKNAPTYWGDQPIVASPNYIGASVIFLFVIALFLIKGRLKWWVVGSSLLALCLSWGYHMGWLTKFFINYVPLYNKFRTVAMIQVLLQLLIPFFGIYGLSKLFSKDKTETEKWHALKWATIITGGVCVFFLLFKTWLFDFSGMHDQYYAQQLGAGFLDAIKADRIAMLTTDSIRSLIFVLLMAAGIWAYLKGKLKKNSCILAFGIIILIDLVAVDRNYVNDSNFVTPAKLANPYTPNAADLQIMKDTTHYRVLDLSTNPMNSARASYFHNSIGGYHAAKPGRIQELFNFYISKGNQQVINMLNIKYYIVKQDDKFVAQRNPNVNGNAWFVNEVKFVHSADEAMLALDSLNTKTTAIVNVKFKDLIPKTEFTNHPNDHITLTHYQANKVIYDYEIAEDRLAIFSEMYYPEGWQISIDGKPVKMAQADYVLRAVYLPKGEHSISFTFEPQIIKTGVTITLIAGIIIGLLLLGGCYIAFKKSKHKAQ